MAFENNYEKKLFSKGLWEPLTTLLASTTDSDKIQVQKELNQAIDAFNGSIYATTYNSSTTVVSELLATGTKKLHIKNNSSTNGENIVIGFGTSAADAQLSASSKVVGKSAIVLPSATSILSTKGYAYFAWISEAGTPTMFVTQGV